MTFQPADEHSWVIANILLTCDNFGKNTLSLQFDNFGFNN
jgi:hypothetical protein